MTVTDRASDHYQGRSAMGRTVQSREDGVSKNEAMQERRHHDRFGGAEGIRRNGQEAHDGTTPEQRGTYEQ